MLQLLAGLAGKEWLKPLCILLVVAGLAAGVMIFLSAQREIGSLKEQISAEKQKNDSLQGQVRQMQQQAERDYQFVSDQLDQALKDNERLAGANRRLKGVKNDDAEKIVAPVLGIALDDVDGLRQQTGTAKPAR